MVKTVVKMGRGFFTNEMKDTMKLCTKYLDKRKIEYAVEASGCIKVGGSLYLQGTKITKKEYSTDVSSALKTKKLTYADGIWGRIISQKGGLAKVKLFGQKQVSYLASSDDGRSHAHGKTAAEAVEELKFKLAYTRGDLSDLHNMPLDTVKTPQEWGFVYRRVTGACKFGTDSFIASKVKKDSYTLAEILEETKGAYGAEQFNRWLINQIS